MGMIKFSNILAVGAHPDDIEYSCLGFLLKQKNLGANVSVYIASNGSRNDQSKGIIRIQESINSMEFNDFTYYQRESGEFNYLEIESEIRGVLNSERFDCVLVHDPNDTHQEHRLIYEITLSACRRFDLSRIRYRSVSSTNFFQSNLNVDVSYYIDFKFQSLAFHRSQSDKPYMSKKAIELFHTLYKAGPISEELYESFYVEMLLS